MLKFVEKLENFYNALVTKITALIVALMHKFLPRSFFRKVDDLQYKFAHKYHQFKKRLRKKGEDLLVTAKDKKEKLFIFLKAAQEYQIKEKIKAKVDSCKSFIFDTPIKEHLKNILKLLKLLLLKLIVPFKKYSNKQISFALLSLMIISLSAHIIYTNGTFIWYKENPYRAPASTEVFEKRPEYYKRGDRTMVVRNVKIPLYIQDTKKVKSILIEFSVTTTTRFAKIYLEHYDHKLRDKIFMSIEPIDSSFPLVEEGKDVIKEKIQNELNQFLIQENVEGAVEAIKILYIIAT